MRRRFRLCAVLAGVLAAMIWPRAVRTHVTTTNTVIFEREIVRILDNHCVACHAPGSPARPLVSYEETWLDRNAILAQVLGHGMPPWAAVPGYGEFANDNGLTLRERQFLVSWVEGLGPRNDGAVFLNVRDAGPRPEVVAAEPDFDTWFLGEPDLIVPLPQAVVAPGQGERIERRVVDPGLESERWLRGLEFRPGDRRVTRAATFTVEATGQWLGSLTPWHGFVELPRDVAYRLPAGTRIVAEIRYGTSDERVIDAPRLGLFWSGGAGVAEPADLVLEARGETPPDAGAVRFAAEVRIEEALHALALFPEFEPGVESLEVSVRKPDGGTEVLLFAQDIPEGWPTPYIFAVPVAIESGSALRAIAYHSNETARARPGGVRLTVSAY